MINQPTFTSHSIITLPHNGLCGILGITPKFDLYAEEIYAPDDDVMQHHIQPDGTILQSAENVSLPSDCLSPQIHPNLDILNYSGGRLRGMREAEHLVEWARPFSIAEKMSLIEVLKLAITPIQLFGLIESAVLSSVALRDDWYVVCRRMVFAIAQSKIQHDKDGLPYDYDSHIIQTAHLYHPSWEDYPSVSAILNGIGNIRLNGAYDVVTYGDKLFISESGYDEKNTIHQWSIEYPVQTG